ncbi:hypothetical protein F965_02187 [Acinetobacter schindleri NIPH 900]|uniref:Uncharacterized protein n=1 Tax=Acinetobacter schindleri NIPH 900 TaxID=1217675 RepID=N8WLG2_9GAMM|nr:cytochrome oxidase putative small subunit CydP [Acinetobacter schindleri]ENV12821.1 hypothetical protein F965_02187 [Acinetobacter schindleri NIPH 900]
MSLVPENLNQKVVREITLILIIKVILLLTIKHIWFDAPTIPKNFDSQVALLHKPICKGFFSDIIFK